MQIFFTKLLWSTLTLTGFLGSIVGFVLPIIPGIPFLILMVYSLRKISPRFHRWLLTTRLAKWLQRREPKLAKWLID
ncbi:MAG: DUF454 family protein [Lactobacillus sp.]|uniref:DUF454 family protein n=1 Tax=Paucilactobacillus vaccinostercus TaxID=176291 RepID=UPI00070D03B8|nr:DUF454 family protein [Paucilactobacillus vaccinostercus]RRG08749.1 MAG: DUF454 family protein [Lactobacillus sp.]